MSTSPLHLNHLTEHSFQAWQEGGPVFVIRDTTDGWKTEGNPATDGLLCARMDELVRHIEGGTR